MSTFSSKQGESEFAFPEYRLEALQANYVYICNQQDADRETLRQLKKEFPSNHREIHDLEEKINKRQQLINAKAARIAIIAKTSGLELNQ
jgi:peptidoglycan hydrolase CwlO-like protein